MRRDRFNHDTKLILFCSSSSFASPSHLTFNASATKSSVGCYAGTNKTWLLCGCTTIHGASYNVAVVQSKSWTLFNRSLNTWLIICVYYRVIVRLHDNTWVSYLSLLFSQNPGHYFIGPSTCG